MEAIVLVLVAGLPWAFGGVDPIYDFALTIGIVLLLLCWACVACLSGKLSFARCGPTVLIAALFGLGVFQLVPLPPTLLRIVSPGTASLNAELLPSQPEQLTADEAAPAPAMNRPISVYPHATRDAVFHWLEVLILFAVVRHQLASTASMRRLAIVAMLTGVAIALFGLFQFFRYGGSSVYGYATLGRAFGPFINRNHAACFLNLCLALGAGLLISVGSDASEYRRRVVQKPNAVAEHEDALSFSPFSVLHSPLQLWILVALAILLAGLMCTLSRGGVASLALAFGVTVVLRLAWSSRTARFDYLLLPIILVVGLLAWMGIKPLETRLSGLWSGDVLADGRWQLWGNLISLVPSFPLFGSGYGTLQFVEPLSRRQADLLKMPDVVVDHAHNDFLEGLIEGGVLRLGLSVALVGLVLMHGMRALRRYADRSPGAWAFGGFFAMLALTVHSFVDFSIETPAIAVLAVVIAAQVVSLNRTDPTAPPSANQPTVLTLRFSPVRLAALSLGAVAVGGVLVLHAWKADVVHRFRVSAYRALQRLKPPDPAQATQMLAAAAELDPDNAELQVELGQVYLDQTRNPKSEIDKRKLVIPGIRHMILARNACPLLPAPHVRIAAFSGELHRTDPPEMYWKRAERLTPSDPELWYLHGVQLLKSGETSRAWESWRRSLSLSGLRLKNIVLAAYPELGVPGLIRNVLPDRPEQFAQAAELLAAGKPPAPPETLKPLYLRAFELLHQRGDDLSPAEFFLKARCAEQVGDSDNALRAYRQAIDLAPTQYEWRWPYAQLLRRTGKLQDALNELRFLIRAFPDRPEIREEYQAVQREIELE